jgi:excisionase family DNA binding protein
MKQLLSPKDLARATGVSESSLKRWADSGRLECTRTAGGHRRIPLAEAVRFIRESSISVLDPSMLGITLQNRPVQSTEESNEYFSELVLSGREEEAIGYLSNEYLSGNGFASLCDGPVRHSLEQVGHAWARTSDGQEKNLRIAEEHRSVDIILQALQQLRRMVQSPETAPVAIGGAPPGDPYLVPSLCAALSLLGDGWRTANLGPSSPFEVLRTAAVRAKAKLVWVSISVESPEANIRQGLEMLSETMLGMNGSVVVGGRKLPEELTRGIPGVHTATTMREMVLFSRGLRVPHT